MRGSRALKPVLNRDSAIRNPRSENSAIDSLERGVLKGPFPIDPLQKRVKPSDKVLLDRAIETCLMTLISGATVRVITDTESEPWKSLDFDFFRLGRTPSSATSPPAAIFLVFLAFGETLLLPSSS